MTKKDLEKEAEIFVSEKADKGNFDVEKFGKAYFSESSMKQALVKFAEKRIAELEATNKKISDECHKLVDTLEKKQNENELLETQNIKLQAGVSKLTIKKAELEKENARLTTNEKSLIAERKIIVKENAELKEKLNIRSCQNCRKYNRTCPNDGSCKNYSKWEGYKNPQLTKAKEILKAVVDFYPTTTATILCEAEQFLRETDIDNAIQQVNECLDFDKITEEIEDDLKESCPDVLCEDCTKDCEIKKLGLIEVEK